MRKLKINGEAIGSTVKQILNSIPATALVSKGIEAANNLLEKGGKRGGANKDKNFGGVKAATKTKANVVDTRAAGQPAIAQGGGERKMSGVPRAGTAPAVLAKVLEHADSRPKITDRDAFVKNLRDNVRADALDSLRDANSELNTELSGATINEKIEEIATRVMGAEKAIVDAVASLTARMAGNEAADAANGVLDAEQALQLRGVEDDVLRLAAAQAELHTMLRIAGVVSSGSMATDLWETGIAHSGGRSLNVAQLVLGLSIARTMPGNLFKKGEGADTSSYQSFLTGTGYPYIRQDRTVYIASSIASAGGVLGLMVVGVTASVKVDTTKVKGSYVGNAVAGQATQATGVFRYTPALTVGGVKFIQDTLGNILVPDATGLITIPVGVSVMLEVADEFEIYNVFNFELVLRTAAGLAAELKHPWYGTIVNEVLELVGQWYNDRAGSRVYTKVGTYATDFPATSI